MTPCTPFNALDARAFTPEAKRQVIEKLLASWLQHQHLRLGQLIVCAISPKETPFYIEDTALVDACASFSAKVSGR